MRPNMIDITGQRFGRLLVSHAIPDRRDSCGSILWLCVCDCGGKKEVSSRHLRVGWTKSCGCLGGGGKGSNISGLRHGNLKHGHCVRKDGRLVRSPEYCAWCHMKERCYRVKHHSYKFYGERGIRVADCWMGKDGFQTFLREVGLRPSKEYSLDRIDPDKNYEPGNVRWGTKMMQDMNKRWTLEEIFGAEPDVPVEMEECLR